MQNRKKGNKKKGNKSIGQVAKLVLQLFILLFLITIASGIFYFYHTYGKTILQLQSEAKQKVSASSEDTFKATQTSLVYDTEGNVISALKAEKDVYYIDYNEIPTAVIDAMVVSEDRKFLVHGGIDYWANFRAAIALIKHKGEITEGASTITQQLARNVFLTLDVTYERKIEEIFVAQELERKYSKSEIMEYYLNGIYFANGRYGIQAAAQGYFGEGVSGLSLSQLVFLCAIPNNPNLYNPESNMDNTLKRRDRILEQMLDEDKITSAQYKEAKNETIELKQEKTDKKDYVETYAYNCAIKALMKNQGFEFRYQFEGKKDRDAYEDAYYELYYSYQKDLYVRGYRIYTSIDLKKQKLLQESVDDALSDFTEVNEEGVYQMQGAAVCIDNDNGRVVAIVGGRDQDLKGYTLNRGYQSYRQPGSSIKPLIVYTPSFEREYTPESTVVDKRFEGGPKNSDGNYLGKIKLQRAIELSKNTIAWKLFKELTPSVGLAYLHKMNFAKISYQDNIPAAALGGFTQGVSPVEMAAAYSTLENDGYYREPTCIVKIMDSEGNEIVGDAIDTTQIYETNAARIMTEALTGVMKKGTGKGLGLTNTISAGKTGTTNDKKDGWFVGYTPYYTTSVWVGYDLPKSVGDLTGASYPGTIWHNYMEQLHDSTMARGFDLYDWRTVLAKEKAEEKKKKEAEIKEKEELEEATSEDVIPDSGEEILEDADNGEADEVLIDSEDEYYEDEFTEDMNSEDEYIGDEDTQEETDEDYTEDGNDMEESTEEEYIDEQNQDNSNSEDGNTEVIEDNSTGDELSVDEQLE
ncbi:MAG: hypothetical protein K0S01_1865 [Herbinix sp.]|nr:hypothetical protein [Herbinix sp.]